MDCPFCREIQKQHTVAALELDKNGNAFIMCDGRADPDGKSCGARIHLAHRNTATLKAMFAKSDRATTDDQPEGEDHGDTSKCTNPESSVTNPNDFFYG